MTANDRDGLARTLREDIGDGVSEARVAGIWGRIDAARDQRLRPARAQIAVGLALAAAAVILLAVHARREEPPAAGTLTLAGGAPLPAHLTTSVSLADGSAITLRSAAVLETLASSPDVVVMAVRSGAARFSITPGGPRRWAVSTPLATIEVVGTIFEVTVEPDALGVAVERGVVTVRGERVPGGVRALHAGESLRLGPAAVAASIDAGPPPAAIPPPPAATPPPPAAIPPPPEPEPAAERFDRGLRRADAARRAGDLELALALLEEVAGGGDRMRAAVASFTRARIELDRMDRPAAALRDLDRALALGLPGALAEEAWARRGEALRRLDR